MIEKISNVNPNSTNRPITLFIYTRARSRGILTHKSSWFIRISLESIDNHYTGVLPSRTHTPYMKNNLTFYNQVHRTTEFQCHKTRLPLQPLMEIQRVWSVPANSTDRYLNMETGLNSEENHIYRSYVTPYSNSTCLDYTKPINDNMMQ